MLVTCGKCAPLIDNIDPWSDEEGRQVLAVSCHCADDGCAKPCSVMRNNGKLVPVRKVAS